MGEAGKEEREKSVEVVDQLNERDQRLTQIKWRDDGEVFATSIPTQAGRRIRLYTREGNHIRHFGMNIIFTTWLSSIRKKPFIV